jgi:phosphohistidine swiveling domain-containing protein
MTKYAVLFDEYNIIPELCRIYGEANTKGIAATIDKDFSEMVFIFKDLRTATICHVREELVEANRLILKRLLEEQDYGKKIIELIIADSDRIIEVTENNLKNVDISGASGEIMWRIYDDFSRLSVQQFVSGCVPMILDGYEPLFTEYITGYVKKKLGGKGDVNEVVSVLLTPEGKTSVAEEEIEFLKLCSELFSEEELLDFLRGNPGLSEFKERFAVEYRLLAAHHDEYHWIPHDFLGHIWDMEYFYQKMLTLAESSKTPDEMLKGLMEKDADTIKLQKRYLDVLDVDEKHRGLIWFAQMSMYTKPYRKERFTHSFYYIYKIYREICKRFGYTIDEVRCLLGHEIKELLLRGKKVEKDVLHKRDGECVLVVADGDAKYVYGDDAKQIENAVEGFDSDDRQSELKGSCACKGRVKGAVKLVFFPSDMDKMNDGDVLVSAATNPDIVPAMKKAGAIVTDQGGITSHAAIVSRELGVPCVIGTKTASKVLKDGDVVEVDATAGVVRVVERVS